MIRKARHHRGKQKNQEASLTSMNPAFSMNFCHRPAENTEHGDQLGLRVAQSLPICTKWQGRPESLLQIPSCRVLGDDIDFFFFFFESKRIKSENRERR